MGIAIINDLTEHETTLLINRGLLNLREADEHIMQDRISPDLLPIRTATYIDYDGLRATIIESKKSFHMSIPENDGWYLLNEFRLPFGLKGNPDTDNVRYLHRKNKWNGLIVRWRDNIIARGTRHVSLYSNKNERMNVLINVKNRKYMECLKLNDVLNNSE